MEERQKITVMIVEDQESIRESIRVGLRLLRQYQFEFIEAGDGDEAWKTLQAGAKPHLIITDIMMPEMDGLSLIQLIKNEKKYQNTPIVVISAKSSGEDILGALGRGAIDYLTKPIMYHDLHRLGRSIELGLRLNYRDTASYEEQVHIEEKHWRLIMELETQRVFRFQDISHILSLCHQLLANYFPVVGRDLLCIGTYEILSNAIIHGNLEISSSVRVEKDGEEKYFDEITRRSQIPPYNERFVTVNLTREKEELRIEVCDEGRGFDPTILPNPISNPASILLPHGRGITIAKSAFDSVTFSSSQSNGTKVLLTKNIAKFLAESTDDE